MNSTKLTVKDSSLAFLVSFLLCQIGVITVTCIALLIYNLTKFDSAMFSTFLNTGIGYLITSLGLYLTMLFVFLFFNHKKENKLISKIKIKKLLIYISIAIASFLSLYPIVTCFDSLLFKLGIPLGTIPYELSTKNYFISLISLVVLPAICEELLFRGLIFAGLKKHGKPFSILISTIMFCIYHMSISQTIYPILMGLLLGVIMYYEENIYYCIAIHLTNNFLSLTLSYFKINLIFQHWTYILLAIILFIAFIAIVLYFIIKNNKNLEKQHINKQDKSFLTISLAIMIFLWIIINLI